MKRSLVVACALVAMAFGQTPAKEQASQTATVSGTTLRFNDTIGTQSNSFELVVTGTPATLTVTITGCMRGGTCGSSLASSSGTANQVLTTTGIFDYYNVAVSWTGGSSPTVTVNRTATIAKSGGGGGGGTIVINGQNCTTGGSCTVGSSFPNVTSGTNTSAAMVNGSGSSLSQSGTGQVASSAVWLANGPGVLSPNIPTLAQSATGGTLTTAAVLYVKVTYVGLAVIEPSGEVKITLAGCTGGNQCSVTVTMPTSCTAGNLPAGVTGCTVWDSTSTGTEKQQAASAACVNITSATCVIGTLAAGSSLVTPSTTGITPTGAQANTCPDNIIPTDWFQGSDGNYYPLAGMDISALNGKVTPPGVFTFCNSLFVNDTSGPPVISNALVSIHHQAGNTTSTGAAFDDRALGVEMIDAGTASPAFDQSLTQYNERILSNNAMTCVPINGGQPYGETCAGAGRFVSADNRSAAGAGSVNLVGAAGVASLNVSANGGFASCGANNPCVVGIQGGAYEGTVTNTNAQNAWFAGGWFGSNGSTGNTNGVGVGVFIGVPQTRFATNNYGLYIRDEGTNAADWNIKSNGTAGTPTSGRNWFVGNVYLPNILQSGGTAIGITGGTNTQGSIQTSKVGAAPQPSSITNVGSAGATSYTYAVVCKDPMGNTTATGAGRSTATGNATLDGTNFNQFQVPIPLAAVSCDVYRTASGGTPSSTGKIGNVTTNDPVTNIGTAGIVFQDKGLAGDNTVIPATDTTGGTSIAGIAVDLGNIIRVASNFTTAANTNLQTITGLQWVLPVTATNYSFHCALSYSQATANAAVAFGIQSATIAPTNIFANGAQQITVGPPATEVNGTLATLTTTTATNIVSGTPGATATNYWVTLDGTIEEPANTGGNTINIMVSTATSGDAVTVLRGSYCRLF